MHKHNNEIPKLTHTQKKSGRGTTFYQLGSQESLRTNLHICHVNINWKVGLACLKVQINEVDLLKYLTPKLLSATDFKIMATDDSIVFFNNSIADTITASNCRSYFCCSSGALISLGRLI